MKKKVIKNIFNQRCLIYIMPKIHRMRKNGGAKHNNVSRETYS